VNEILDLLAHIQAKDLALDEIAKTLTKGPERIEKREQAMGALDDELSLEKEKIDQTKKRQRQYEMDVEVGLEKIKKSKTRLIEIKNNKEYQAVLAEIDLLQASNTEKEDKILACMEEMEQLSKTLLEKEQRVDEIKGEFKKELESIRSELEEAKSRLSAETRDRQAMAEKIDSAILEKYERLKSVRGGLAVVRVADATCGGCNMNIPPQMYNELQRRDTLAFCPNCERMIYWNKINSEKDKGMPE
jgi:predicted  nucleic acid-binding Zn-ribbon protein